MILETSAAPSLAFVAPGEQPLEASPWPLVGLDPAMPAHALLDAVIEPPFTPAAVAAGIARAPLAAAAAAQLLRAIESLPPAAALSLESMCYAMLQGSAEHRAWLVRARATAANPGTVAVRREGSVLYLCLDRAHARNAIDRPMRDGLVGALEIAALDPDIAAVRLTAAGRCFSAGADLAEFGTTRDPATAHAIRARTLPAHLLARIADRLHVHVQGACVGAGLEMAAFAHRLTAAPDAWFQLPELAMGVVPGAGGCVSIPARIGRHRTALLLFSGRRIPARLALAWGLIDGIVDAPPTDERRADEAESRSA